MTPRTWIERDRRRLRRTVIACVVIALVLTTLDRPGARIYAIDALVVVACVLWRRLRRGARFVELRKGDYGGRS